MALERHLPTFDQLPSLLTTTTTTNTRDMTTLDRLNELRTNSQQAFELIELLRDQVAKTELELELVQNEDRNNKQALRDLTRSKAAAEESMRQWEQQLATTEARLNVSNALGSASGQQRRASQMQNRAAEEMEKAALMQNEADEEKKLAIQEQERCTRLESQLRDELAQSCLMQNEAAKTKEKALLMQKEVKEESENALRMQERYTRLDSQLRAEIAESRSMHTAASQATQHALADNQSLREQVKQHTNAMLGQTPHQATSEQLEFQRKSFLIQQVNAEHHHRQQMDALEAQLKHANLQDSTNQQIIYDLQKQDQPDEDGALE